MKKPPKKNRGDPPLGRPGAPATRSRRITLSFFSLQPPPESSVRGMAFGAPASIPTRFAIPWFAGADVASRLNRGSASDTARRHVTPARVRHTIGLTAADREYASFRSARAKLATRPEAGMNSLRRLGNLGDPHQIYRILSCALSSSRWNLRGP